MILIYIDVIWIEFRNKQIIASCLEELINTADEVQSYVASIYVSLLVGTYLTTHDNFQLVAIS